STTNQNEFTKQAIEESILSPVTKDKSSQQDQGAETNNNEITSKGNEHNPGEEQQTQNSRQTIQKNRVDGIDSVGQCCDSSSSTIPTEIRNQPGLQLVVDLYENKENRNNTNQEDDISDSFQEAEQSNNQKDMRKEDQHSHNHNEDQQQTTKRGRSETRKSGKRNRHKTQPSLRRNQKEDITPNCLND
ncbi:hypothetical protein A4A49_57286, partial [Nicotiana attenuata]